MNQTNFSAINGSGTKPRKIKIVHTIRQGRIGGGETHLLSIVENIDLELFEIVVLSFSGGEMIDRLNKLGIKNYIIETERPFDVFKWSAIEELIKSERPDILHAHGTRACSNTYKAASKLSIPLIYTIHGWSFHDGQKGVTRLFRQKIEKYLCQKSQLNICVSEHNAQEGKNKLGLSGFTVVPNGVDLNKFNFDLQFSNVRKEFRISDNTILVGYVARVTEQKDPFTFIKAVELVVQKNHQIKFLFVGSGDLLDEAISLTRKLKITEHIQFLGSRTDIPAILKAIDIYCLPSLWEGLPIGVLEAMAMKKAVIATAVDGTKEIIQHGENGLLIDPQSPQKLADAILLLIENKELKLKLSENGRKTVEGKYNIKEMAVKISKLYQGLLF